MKKTKSEGNKTELAEMRPEYDFAGKKGERGKYSQAYRQGHAVRIHEEDGTTAVQYFSLEDGAVMLEPDVREYFSDSESVNQALRGLISLIPDRPARKTAAGKARKGSAQF
jgi:hypothetical protein